MVERGQSIYSRVVPKRIYPGYDINLNVPGFQANQVYIAARSKDKRMRVLDSVIGDMLTTAQHGMNVYVYTDNKDLSLLAFDNPVISLHSDLSLLNYLKQIKSASSARYEFLRENSYRTIDQANLSGKVICQPANIYIIENVKHVLTEEEINTIIDIVKLSWVTNVRLVFVVNELGLFKSEDLTAQFCRIDCNYYPDFDDNFLSEVFGTDVKTMGEDWIKGLIEDRDIYVKAYDCDHSHGEIIKLIL